MSLPDQMTDRWRNRPEPAPGEVVVSGNLLMRDYPEVVDLARQAQQRLAGFDGLHMTPLRWLHVTTLLAGPAADFSPDKLRQMTQTAAGLLEHAGTRRHPRSGPLPSRSHHARRHPCRQADGDP